MRRPPQDSCYEPLPLVMVNYRLDPKILIMSGVKVSLNYMYYIQLVIIMKGHSPPEKLNFQDPFTLLLCQIIISPIDYKGILIDTKVYQ